MQQTSNGPLRRALQSALHLFRRVIGIPELSHQINGFRVDLDAQTARALETQHALETGLNDFLAHMDAKFDSLAVDVGKFRTEFVDTLAKAATEAGERQSRIERDVAALVGRLYAIEELTARFRAVYLGRGRILVNLRHLPIVLIANSNDRLIIPHLIQEGEYESEVTAWLMSNMQPAYRCLDVGANIGYHTCVMAKLAPKGAVVSIEPDSDSFDLLVENVNVNWLEGVVQPLSVAVSDAPGELTLHRLKNRSANTSIGALTQAEASDAHVELHDDFVAQCNTVDALSERLDCAVDVMKIDVEGAESLVLRGARRSIKENPGIRILMEWSPDQLHLAGSSAEELLDEIDSQDLTIHRLRLDGTEEPAADRSLMLSTRYWNVILRRSPHEATT